MEGVMFAAAMVATVLMLGLAWCWWMLESVRHRLREAELAAMCRRIAENTKSKGPPGPYTRDRWIGDALNLADIDLDELARRYQQVERHQSTLVLEQCPTGSGARQGRSVVHGQRRGTWCYKPMEPEFAAELLKSYRAHGGAGDPIEPPVRPPKPPEPGDDVVVNGAKIGTVRAAYPALKSMDVELSDHASGELREHNRLIRNARLATRASFGSLHAKVIRIAMDDYVVRVFWNGAQVGYLAIHNEGGIDVVFPNGDRLVADFDAAAARRVVALDGETSEYFHYEVLRP